MPNNTDTLVSIFEDIGNALEDWDLTGPWTPSQFAAAIASIEDHAVEDALISKTLSGAYSNSRVTSIGPYALRNFSDVTSFDFPNVTSVPAYCFTACTSLISVNLPIAGVINQYSFQGCSALTAIALPSSTAFGRNVFENTNLTTLDLYSPNRTAIPTLNINGFNNTPIAAGNGHVVINDELVTALSTASNWSALPSGTIIGHTTAVQQGIV